MNLLFEVALLQIIEKERGPTPSRPEVRVVGRDSGLVAGRESAHSVVIPMQRQPDLFEVVLAFQSTGSLADSLHGRQKQADQHCHDGYHDEKFNQGESATSVHI